MPWVRPPEPGTRQRALWALPPDRGCPGSAAARAGPGPPGPLVGRERSGLASGTPCRVSTTPPCAGKTWLFFSRSDDDQAEAKALCAGCEVRAACLERAMTFPHAFADDCGVWGGTTPLERRLLRRERAAR